MRIIVGVALLIIGAVVGMAWRGPVEPAVAAPRFVPVPLDGRQGLPWSGFFALDTQTGALCRTSNFILEGEGGWMALPMCAQVK